MQKAPKEGTAQSNLKREERHPIKNLAHLWKGTATTYTPQGRVENSTDFEVCAV